jgi:hypothetical protein
MLPTLAMNTPSKLLLALTAAAALSFAHPASANLITNGGFETGDFTDWGTVGNGFVSGTFMGVAPHSGNYQAVFPGPGNVLDQFLNTTPGQIYTINFFLANVASNLPHSLAVTWNGNIVFFTSSLQSFGYTEYTFNVTASGTDDAITFFPVAFEGGALFLDDVSVNPAGVGVPDGGPTVSLLGSALLGLAAVRRKLGC